MKYAFVLLLPLIFLTGCRYIPFWPDSSDKLEEVQAAHDTLTQEETEKSRQLTTAVVDVLKDEKEEDVTPHSKLALQFAIQDQLIEGFPIKPIPTQDYITLAVSTDENDVEKLARKIRSLEKEVSEFRKTQQDNQVELDARTEELVRLGKLYEEQNKKNFWEKVWSWSRNTLGIGGVIAVMVLFPAVIPIFGQILGQFVKIIPSFASAIGVAAVSTVDSVIKGVQGAKAEIKSSKKDTFTKEEVLEIISRNSNDHQGKDARTLVNQRKTKLSI